MSTDKEQRLGHAKVLLMGSLTYFIGKQQRAVLADLLRGEERHAFADLLIDLDERIRTMPKTYEQDGKGKDAVVYLHYFAGGSFNAWITEKDMGDDTDSNIQHQAFGYVNEYGHDIKDAGSGYVSIVELMDAGAEIDLHWTPKTIRECAK